MKHEDLRVRTKRFALMSLGAYRKISHCDEARICAKQFIRSATSVGAHYREAYRAKSDADFISKIEGALQELDESSYWAELMVEGKFVASEAFAEIMREANELTAIFVTIVTNTKKRQTETKRK